MTSYCGLSTKIRAMHSRLLTNDNMQEIVEMTNVPSVVSYLKQTSGYETVLADINENELHRGQLEPILRETVFRDFNKIYRFANQNQREFLSLYFMRYEIKFLKTCLTRMLDVRKPQLEMTMFEKYFSERSDLNFQALRTADHMEDFLLALEGSVYYETVHRIAELEQATLFDYEAALDLFHFRYLWKKKGKIHEKQSEQQLTQILGSKFELLNIQWIYRCRRFYQMSAPDIYALLIPAYLHVSKDEIRAMVEAPDLKTLENLIHQNYYGRKVEEVSFESLETYYSLFLKTLLTKKARNNPYSLSMIYNYLYHKDHEVDQLIIALECVRYQLPPSVAMEHVLRR